MFGRNGFEPGFSKDRASRNPWKTQRITVAYRVYCMIFWRPPSSFCILASCGITAPSNCSMIDALIYGMIPNEKIAQFSSAPPLKMLKSAATDPPACVLTCVRNHSCNTAAFTPGVVICAPARTTITMIRLKMIRARSSGTLSELAKAESMEALS